MHSLRRIYTRFFIDAQISSLVLDNEINRLCQTPSPPPGETHNSFPLKRIDESERDDANDGASTVSFALADPYQREREQPRWPLISNRIIGGNRDDHFLLCPTTVPHQSFGKPVS